MNLDSLKGDITLKREDGIWTAFHFKGKTIHCKEGKTLDEAVINLVSSVE